MIPHILKSTSISLFIGGKAYVADRSIPEWDALVVAINAGDEAGALAIIDKPKSIGDRLIATGVDGIEITENAVYHNGRMLTNYAASRLLEMKSIGLDIGPIAAFIGRLLQNPSHRAVTELFKFLEKSDMPITADGYFLAYKVVRSNFKDRHSGTVDNTPGVEIPRMERHEVDDNPNNTCSYGYHVCSQDYIQHFYCRGDHLLLCKVDPADVVAVPVDYDATKMRVAFYEVLKEIEAPLEWQSRVVDPTGDSDYDYDADAIDDDDYFDAYEDVEIKVDGVTVQGSQGTLKNLLGRLFKRS